MKKKLLLLLAAAGASLLPALELPVKAGKVDVIFQTKGGGIDSITWNGGSLTCGKGSFTERVMADTVKNGKPAQLQERFDNLEFEARFLRRWGSETILAMSARGIGAFDWLKIEKIYTEGSSCTQYDGNIYNLSSINNDITIYILVQKAARQ